MKLLSLFCAIVILVMSCTLKPGNTDMHAVGEFLTGQVVKNKTPFVQFLIFNKDSDIHDFRAGYADLKAQKEIANYSTFRPYLPK